MSTTSAGVSVANTYDAAGNNLTTITTASGTDDYLKSRYSYSSSGNHVTQYETVNGVGYRYTYSSTWHRLTSSRIYGMPYQYYGYYSNSDRLYQTYIKSVISLAYNYSSGNLTGLKRKTYLDDTTDNPVWQYYNLNRDAFGNIRSITIQKSTDGSTWSSSRTLASYTYSGNNGHMTRMTWGNGAFIDYGYDLFDRVVQQSYNDGTTYRYQYNANGDLARQYETDADGGTVRSCAFEYDSLDRLIRSRETDADGNLVQRTEHIYDNANRLTSQSYQIMGTGTHKETYTYDGTDGKLTKQGFVFSTTGTASITLAYDALKRLETETAKKGSATVFTRTYDYRDSTTTENRTTLQVTDIGVTDKNGDSVLSRHYNYNAYTDITSVTDGTNTLAEYTYDDLRRLTAETRNYTKYSGGVGTAATYSAAYTYDTGGNILTATKTMPGAEAVSHVYTYDDSRWPDLLTAYDGHSILYDEIGNPTSYYNGTSYTMSWSQGRRLETIQTGNKTITFAYDMDGIRVAKTVVTDTDAKRTTSQTDYITQSGLVVQQTTVKTILTKSTNETTTTTRVLEFTYDSQQRPFCVLDTYTKTDGTQSQTRYYYVLNLQGDVIALMTGSGSIWATYTYDAWGKNLQVLNGSNTALSSTSTYFANVNPLRYRGYYYDTETSFYYLQSRYYDPSIGRFINADSYISTAQGFAGYNMFLYCLNNPVNYKDSSGNIVVTATIVVASAVAEILFEICISVLVVAAIIEVAHELQQYAPAKKENSVENKLEIKSVSTPASPQSPNNKNDKNNGEKRSIKKLTSQQLKKYGLDAHEIKRDYLGKKANIKFYDLFYDTRTGTVYIGNKSGSVIIDTYYNVFYGMCF